MSTFAQFFPSSGPSGNSGSFSGSFQGDGSKLTSIPTSSYALTASYLNGFIESASYALTASYALNGGGIIGSGSTVIDTVISSSTLIDSVITGSTVIDTTITGSTIIDTTITGSTVLDTTITGSTVIDTTITGSTIIDTVISSSTLVDVVGSGSFSGSFVGDGSQLTNITASTAETAETASYITSSNVDGPRGFDSVLLASHALTASYLDGFIESASYAATASYLDGFIESASYAAYAATSSIRYDSGSGVITGLNSIKINDFDDNVGVTFQDAKLTLTFGSPVIPSISNFFNSGFLTDRFNQVLDSYNTIGDWDNGGYTFVEASILQGSTVLSTTTTPGSTNLTLPQSTSGSQSYTLIYTGSSPLDGSEYRLSSTVTSSLFKTLPDVPSMSATATVQLGGMFNQIEQGSTGSIAFSSAYSSSNGWDQVSITNTPSSSPILVTGGGSTGITIQTVTAYESPTGDNNPQLTTNTSSSIVFSKIRSVRYGASTATSFTESELEDLGSWDTTLGGTIGTIDKGNTYPSGDTLTITWSGDKYQYIIYDSNRSDLTGIATSGFGVIGQFTKSTVGDYTVYRTNVLQAGGSGASITYNLT